MPEHNGEAPSDFSQSGLPHRYDVKKVVDPEGKHDDCRYFVLDPQHDSGARFALRAYKVWASRNGYDNLAKDLGEWLEEIGG